MALSSRHGSPVFLLKTSFFKRSGGNLDETKDAGKGSFLFSPIPAALLLPDGRGPGNPAVKARPIVFEPGRETGQNFGLTDQAEHEQYAEGYDSKKEIA